MTKPLWTPPVGAVESSQMGRFLRHIRNKTGLKLRTYADLYRWSTEQSEHFWREVWNFTKVRSSKPFTQALSRGPSMIDCKWFQGARLNFAENLLRYQDDRTAIIFKGDTKPLSSLTYRELFASVAAVAHSLKKLGVVPGDRVAGYLPNVPEAVSAMLAATSLGAVWSGLSPDMGPEAVIKRIQQLEPKILFTVDRAGYGRIDCLKNCRAIAEQVPSIKKIVVVGYADPNPNLRPLGHVGLLFKDFLCRCGKHDRLTFAQVPFDHPILISFTSGTTGTPKAIVHGSGILLEHLKELILHTDIRRNDVVFYATSAGWMMWNWLVSVLATGATVLLYDGSPLLPHPGFLFEVAQKTRVTVFGTSAHHLGSLERLRQNPGARYDLSSIRTILSTGSPLPATTFRFVYDKIKRDVQLSSISGGTEICGCFGLGNPLLPVYPGEIQCLSLGMKVEIQGPAGKCVIGEKGELTCSAPFPSMPVSFWDDPSRERYRAAYFKDSPGRWRHGDFALINKRGGLVIFGRSDATLKPGGVRIGPAEIYQQVGTIPGIEDCLAVGQKWQNDERIVLFVKLKKGKTLTPTLRGQISDLLQSKLSRWHVPDVIIRVPEIPYTVNMKKVELLVRSIVNREPLPALGHLLNPDSLKHYRNLPELS